MTAAQDDFIRRAAEAQAAEEAARRANGYDPGSLAPLAITIAAELAGKPVPERAWLVENWIPSRQVTLLSGDGGVGKSLLAMGSYRSPARAR
jgi:hypothetical protein